MKFLLEKLKLTLENKKGVRVGETTVISKKVHVINQNHPQIVNIISNADAGVVFYNRPVEDEIIHIDLFHEIAICNVSRLSKKLINDLKASPARELIDYIDIQTADGGGRLTGSLNYGNTEAIKKSHLNHVHIAVLLPNDLLKYIFLLVDSIEKGLLEQNIELRKINKIVHKVGNMPVDLSDYTTESDSKLKNRHNSETNYKQESIKLINQFGSVEEVALIFDLLTHQKAKTDFPKKDICDILDYLNNNKFIEIRNGKYKLTNSGENFRNYIIRNQKELETILKKIINNFAKRNNIGQKISATKQKFQKNLKSNKGIAYLTELKDYDTDIELDVIETTKKALVRCFEEENDFYISQKDLVIIKRIAKSRQDICLVIDASASMAGKRLRNAKYLARYLILNTNGRVSVLAFQEKEVVCYVPFTRNFNTLEKGLYSISSNGLTPLASAIYKGVLHVKKSGSIKKPQIILITDGIPTVSLWSQDPIEDAIRAALTVSTNRIEFTCIGLQPNQECLTEIVDVAKGRLFVVEELNKRELLNVAHDLNLK